MKYQNLNKEELLALIAERQAKGRMKDADLSGPKATLIDLLVKDDELGENQVVSNSLQGLPEVESLPAPVQPGEVMPEKYSGIYINKNDGEPYGKAVIADEPNGRTHFAKNTVHFWNGTEEEFNQTFSEKR